MHFSQTGHCVRVELNGAEKMGATTLVMSLRGVLCPAQTEQHPNQCGSSVATT